MLNSPNVHLIQFHDLLIVFDVNKNDIVLASRDVFDSLRFMKENNMSCDEYISLYKSSSVANEILRFCSNGYFKSKRPQYIEHTGQKFYTYFLGKKMRKLILQVTQDCNFRCSYCDYTCGSIDFHRSHSATNMSWDVALKALKFFKSHCQHQNKINISFYGGEPLLNYVLIQKCIEYVKKEFVGKDVSYNLTTNGSLLTMEKALYLIDNNVNITVSIDGPERVHNKNRKFAANGRGTHRNVINNLRKIYVSYPEHYSKISFNCVVDPRLWNDDCNGFFSTDLFKNNHVIFSPMHPVNGRAVFYPDTFLAGQKKAELSAAFKIIKQYEHPLNVESRYFFEEHMNMQKQMNLKSELPDVCGHSGPCMPGVHRLFVTVSGGLFPCEKANESSPIMNLGSVLTGLSENNARRMLNVTCVDAEKCRKCWGILHCNICACSIDGGDEYSKTLMTKMCGQVLSQLERKIIREAIYKEFDKLRTLNCKLDYNEKILY